MNFLRIPSPLTLVMMMAYLVVEQLNLLNSSPQQNQTQCPQKI
jgi:hypothetical protein